LSEFQHRGFAGLCIDLHVNAGTKFHQQAGVNNDLLWIRNEFLNSDLAYEKMVIYGHSPYEWPEVKPNRVNIDTGAFATGRLTCLVIEGGRGRFLFTA
jgi:hypothetical protein